MGINRFFVFFNLLSFVISFILLLQSYNIVTIIPSDVLSFRDGGMRSFLGTYPMTLSSLYFISRYFCINKRNLVDLLKSLYFIYCLFSINQSRSLLFAIGVGIFFVVFQKFYDKLKRLPKTIKIIFIFIIISFLFLYLYSFIQSIVNQSIDSGEASSVKRIESYTYYWNTFLSFPLLGVGFSIPNSLIEEGVILKLYVDDIGLIGYLAQGGIIGFLLLVYLFIIYFKVSHNIKNVSNLYYVFYTSAGITFIALLPFNCIVSTSGLSIAILLGSMGTLLYTNKKTKLVSYHEN
jgi:hypothetical protein